VLFGLLLLAIILAADFQLLGPARLLHAFPLADKVGHFLLFGLLNFFVVRAMQGPRRIRSRLRAAAWPSVLILVFASLEEWSQRYFAGRTASALDVVASAAGIAAFGLAAALWRKGAASAEDSPVKDRRA